MTGAGVLVVGYGNPLRSDDGIGWHAARLLATDPRLDRARVLTRHQLAPELAEDVSRASLVVLVDAAAEGDRVQVMGPGQRRVLPGLDGADCDRPGGAVDDAGVDQDHQ